MKAWTPIIALGAGALLLTTAAIAQPGGGPGGFDGHRGPQFSQFDMNGDGAVSQDEVNAWRDAHFASLDTDGDGLVSRDEMIAVATARVEERVDANFAYRDLDEDGMLSQNELMGRGTPMFDRLDTDGDGLVTEAEVATRPYGHRR